MKATLKIECFGDASSQTLRGFKKSMTNYMGPEMADALIGKISARYYVAEIIGLDPKYKFRRKFLKPNKDYTHANSKGTRGVYAWYILEFGNVYEVKEPVSWKSEEKYFCMVTEEGDIKKLTEQEVAEWVKFF